MVAPPLLWGVLGFLFRVDINIWISMLLGFALGLIPVMFALQWFGPGWQVLMIFVLMWIGNIVVTWMTWKVLL